jgi:hypothetical protein
MQMLECSPFKALVACIAWPLIGVALLLQGVPLLGVGIVKGALVLLPVRRARVHHMCSL